jgi:hypothetical protein
VAESSRSTRARRGSVDVSVVMFGGTFSVANGGRSRQRCQIGARRCAGVLQRHPAGSHSPDRPNCQDQLKHAPHSVLSHRARPRRAPEDLFGPGRSRVAHRGSLAARPGVHEADVLRHAHVFWLVGAATGRWADRDSPAWCGGVDRPSTTARTDDACTGRLRSGPGRRRHRTRPKPGREPVTGGDLSRPRPRE